MTELSLQTQKEKEISTKELELRQLLRTILTHRLELLSDASIAIHSDRETLIQQTLRFIKFFDIDISFFSSKTVIVRPYVIIGLVDTWIQTVNLDEKKAILDLVKILCSDEWVHNPPKKQRSNRVVKQALLGLRLGTEFISGHKVGVNSHYWTEKIGVANANANQSESDRLSKIIKSESSDSPLHQIRLKLGTVESEKSFNVFVLSITRFEMAQRFGGTLAFFSDNTIYVPSDFDSHLLEHEYIHTQQPGFNFGYNFLLGRALMEAWTEQQTQEPIYYEKPRKILGLVLDHLPVFTQRLADYYRSPKVNKLDQAYLSLLAGFGLEGLIALLRLETDDSCTSEDSSDYHGKYIFQPAEIVEAKINASKIKPATTNFDVLSDPITYLDEDAGIFEWMIKHEEEGKIEAKCQLDLINYERKYKNFSQLASNVYTTGGNSIDQFSTAITFYLNNILGAEEKLAELLPYIVQCSVNEELFNQIINICLESFEGFSGEKLREKLRMFFEDLRQACGNTKEQQKTRLIVNNLTDGLITQAFESQPENLLLGVDLLYNVLGRLHQSENQELISHFISVWEKIKITVDVSTLVGEKGVKSLFYLIEALVRFINQCNGYNLKHTIHADINWLLELIDDIPGVYEGYRDQIDERKQDILNSISSNAQN